VFELSANISLSNGAVETSNAQTFSFDLTSAGGAGSTTPGVSERWVASDVCVYCVCCVCWREGEEERKAHCGTHTHPF
jgi:hypothetical protein